MNPKEHEILLCLIDSYERSILSKQGSDQNRGITCDLDKKFPVYNDYEYYDKILEMEQDVDFYVSKGWVFAEISDVDNKYHVLKLNLDTVDEVYKYLDLPNPVSLRIERTELFSRYRNKGIDPYVDDILLKIKTFKNYKQLIFEDLDQQKKFLDCLCAIMSLKEDTLQRVFSAKVFGNSKAFEKHFLNKTVSVIKHYFPYEEEEDPKHILAQYHILQNPGHLILKGHGLLEMNGSLLDIEDFSEGLTLSSADVSKISLNSVEDKTILTIENLTTFYQCARPDTLVIYLGGYHNSVRSEFLKRVYEKFPNKTYLHAGDIDAGGFDILEHLKNKTGIPFHSYSMDYEVLERYKNYTQQLTENDRDRLKKFLSVPEYAETIAYMLEHDMKLEQEQIVEL